MSVLEAAHLRKQFGDFVAVEDISFSLSEGEILGVLGPNGAGKTTMIQMLLGILTPTSGEVSYFGKDLKTNREWIMERVNFSSTYTNLPWWLTVKENLTWVSYLYEIQSRKKRISEVVEIFRLGEIFSKRMDTLSAGQLTRVNVAKAFLNSPKVLLLDEPTASLDVEVAKYIRDFLLSEREKSKISIVITSHNMNEVEQLCDRVMVINKGKVVADNTPEQLAGSIKMSHIELLFGKGSTNFEKFCKAGKFSYTFTDKRFVMVDVATDDIPDFLRGLHASHVAYEEISITRPSLEDYFMQVVEG